MYVKFGDLVKNDNEIVGFFDIDNAAYSKKTSEFLSKAEKQGRLINLTSDIPVSFVLSTDNVVYFTRTAAKSLKNRRG